MNRIRVLLGDKHTIVREGLRCIINGQPDLAVVAEASTGYELADHIRDNHPRVVSMEVTLPGPGLARTIKHCEETSPQTRFLILTSFDDPVYFHLAMAAGAQGYLLKSTLSSAYLDAIRRIASGDRVIDPCFQGEEHESPSGRMQCHRDLSHRESEVLELLAQGHTHKEIADHLHVSVKSVDTYCARLRSKTGLKTRADFVRFGLDAGMLHAAEQ